MNEELERIRPANGMLYGGAEARLRADQRTGGLLNPEDENPGLTNPKPRPGQLDKDDYVERSRRMQSNDIENIPAFLFAGLLFVFTQPPLVVAQVLFYGFVATRLGHFWAYFTAKSHEVRATFFTFGSLIVIGMAVYTLIFAIR